MANVINTRLIGVEWVVDYAKSSYRPTPLTNSGNNAAGFYQTLAITGIKRFNYGNQHAWDQDLEFDFSNNDPALRPAFPYGESNNYAEKVDILYFCGHGKPEAMLFGEPGHDNLQAHHNEMQLGVRKVLKWLVADACQVLQQNFVITRWGHVFKGLRYLLGFHGDSRNVHNRGEAFARQLNLGLPLKVAWELACEETEGVNAPWAYLHRGHPGGPVANDKWTVRSLPEDTDPPNQFTYLRNQHAAIL